MKTLKFLLILCVLIICISNSSFAQYTLKGTITDGFNNESFAGVSIIIKNTQIGTVSDVDGKYEINGLTKGSHTFVFSFVGYITKEIEINFDQDSIVQQDVFLEEDSNAILEECVVVGYGVQKKLTGSVSGIRVRGISSSARGARSRNAVGYDGLRMPKLNTEKYDSKEENNFKDTKTDPISVFSSDVDNASYSNVRRFLNQSKMPAQGSVRIEEMINYFDYSYDEPTDNHPISIYTEINKCAWNPDHELLQIGIKAKDINPKEIPNSNLVFLIDVSGSMDDENKLPLLARSFKVLAQGLRENDYVSIVTYAGENEVKLQPTKCDKNGKEQIIKILDGLSAGGWTAGFNAIGKAYSLAQENFIKDGNNRILLATDGDFNVGQSSNAALENLIKQKAKSGIYLTVLGFGMGNYNDSMMEKISNCGNGNYFYIDNFSEAKKALGTGLWGTLFTVAKDVKILVDFNPNIVKSYRLIGYENRLLNNEDFNDDKKDAGDMGAGHTVTALYELVTNNSKEIPEVSTVQSEYSSTSLSSDFSNYLTVKFRYKNPQDTISQLIEKRVSLKDKKENASNDFILAENVALFGQLLSKSKFTKKSTYKDILENLKNIPSDDKGYIDELKVLVRKADDL